MATIQQAIEYAKNNPDSAFASELRRRIESGEINPQETQVAQAQPMGVGGQIDRIKSDIKEAGGDIKEFGQGIKETFQERGAKFGEAVQLAKEGKNFGEKAKRGVLAAGSLIGQTLGAASDILGNAIAMNVKLALPGEAEDKIQKTVTQSPVVQKLGGVLQKFEELKQKDPEAAVALDSATGIFQFLTDIAGGGVATKGAKAGVDIAETGLRQTSKLVEKVGQGAEDVVTKIRNVALPENLKDKAVSLLATEPDDIVVNTLREIPESEFDDAVKIAEKAQKQRGSVTLLERAGDKMQEATKVLDEQRKTIGKEMSDYLSGTRYGFDPYDMAEFSDEMTSLLNRTRKQSDRKIVNEFITRAKEVKTKNSANQLIQDLQDTLYRGTQDKTLPRGSALERQLQGITGSAKGKLRSSLPEEFGKLSDEYARYADNLESLNSALGEVIDGTATRGASLIKQYFSPAGRRAKELFQFINEKTGVDLGKDAVLAKYLGEVFGDPKVRSLLEGGIPTSPGGVIEKTATFAAERLGLGKKVRELSETAKIRRAREFTKKQK